MLFRSFTDDHPGAVINKQTLTDFSAWMYFNVGNQPGKLGNQASQKKQPAPIKTMSCPVQDDGM